jgi:hypothetical protein
MCPDGVIRRCRAALTLALTKEHFQSRRTQPLLGGLREKIGYGFFDLS